MTIDKITLFDIEITIGKYQTILDRIVELAKTNSKGIICFANSHMIVEAMKNSFVLNVLKSSLIVTTDGMPLTWLAKKKSKKPIDRVAGMDLFTDIFKYLEIQSVPIFFYGNTESVLNNMNRMLLEKYPNLKISGMISPPFHQLTPVELDSHINMIRESGASIVFVSLGCPKQEIWMYENYEKMNCLLLGVGNAFTTFIGEEKRLPKKFRNLGLEWLYRLLQNPKRLWRRYFITNSVFLWFFIRELWKR